MNEDRFRSNVQDVLQDLGFYYTTYNPLQKGIPDIHATIEGHSCWFELKYSDKAPKLDHPVSAPQVDYLVSISKAGGIAGVVCGAKETVGFTDGSDLDIQPYHRLPEAHVEPSPEALFQWILKSKMDGVT